jgi:hypothetical protein
VSRERDAWLTAFEGIDYLKRDGAENARVGDLPDVLSPRLRGRLNADTVRVPIQSLMDIAKRIDALSRRVVELESGGPILTEESLRAYEAQQEAAERAAVKVGVLAEDAEGDWAALYDHRGKLARETGHVSDVRSTTVRDGWSVTVIDCEGLLDGDVGEDFPPTIDGLRHLMAKRSKA